MTDNNTTQTTGSDKRRFPRIALSKAARARAKDNETEGTIQDISASGAFMKTNQLFEENAPVDLTIDGLNHSISGHVVRAFDDGVAVEFELEAAEEEALLREINGLYDSSMKSDEF